MKKLGTYALSTIGFGVLVGVASGIASAVFLLALDHATHFRVAHEYLVYFLPFAGIALGLAYQRWGMSIVGGNNLVLDTLHEDRSEIPFRMAPMVLVGTVATHLFGGSAGREGTAVQMGASLADAIAHRCKLVGQSRRALLCAGIAGGFGSVFGTPIAGTIFGVEVIVMGQLQWYALLPAVIAAFVGDRVTRAIGVVHTLYPHPASLSLTWLIAGKWIVFGVAVGLTAIAFIELTHGLKHFFEKRVPRLPVRMMMGGIAVVAMWKLVGTSDYLGLGVPTIVGAFSAPAIAPYAFALKLVFTAVTLATGFIGGEVTPLFFVGATLGSALAHPLGLPVPLCAAVGLATLFGAAANTPIALCVMAVELLGVFVFPHVVIAAVVAYFIAGNRGIYPAQRLGRRKLGHALSTRASLRDLHRY